ncbi:MULTISPECIES: quinolinate synthase NadA [unclassified Desulfurobacterium]|uniref:quinolinate synthase NadA n=1 Tax=Desulfurobacterium sp. TC5-1 TaxID=1158318 RepID=UPI0003B5DB93|nr:quinolinate synthase NadA [Desulfurobacterium sp. TC5-1]
MEILKEIKKLKKEKNAVILAHYYQDGMIQDIADFVGDSLELARKAVEIEAETVLMCGVYFMAETVKILNPEKKVLIPYPKAGCLMADMVIEDELKAFKEENPDYTIVTYVNSSAAVKALSDICCTSANAVKVVSSVEGEKVLFVPDKNLGSYVAEQVKDKEIKLWNGYCPVHEKLTAQWLEPLKKKYPNAEVVVHPECSPSVRKLADFIGSTSQIIRHVKASDKDSFIVGTERGIIHQLKKIKPEATFISAYETFICDQMRMITLDRIANSLKNGVYEVKVDAETAEKAKRAIERMLAL